MNKKEISEIRKQFTFEGCTIHYIRTCFIDNDEEKTIKSETESQFLTLPEEERHKYIDIFKKGLSGHLGKNLFNLDFPTEAEKEGNPQHMLYKLKESHIKDQDMSKRLFQAIRDNYISIDKYVIILISGTYDVPLKGKDGKTMEDASDTVYNYVYALVCPVTMTKGELGYITKDKRIGEIPQNFIVKAPDKAFLFPAFNDRDADIHSMLYYTKKPDIPQPELVKEAFSCNLCGDPLTETEGFKDLIKYTAPEKNGFEVIKEVYTNLNETIKEKNSETLDEATLEKVFSDSGMETESFSKSYEDALGDKNTGISAPNIEGLQNMKINAGDIEIKAKSNDISKIKTHYIEGRKYLLIEANNDIVVNGVKINL